MHCYTKHWWIWHLGMWPHPHHKHSPHQGAILFSLLSTEFCVVLRFVVSMCITEKRTDSVFLSISYQDHVTVMAASGDAQFDENLFISTILALHEAFQEEEEKSESALSHEDNKRLLLATIVWVLTQISHEKWGGSIDLDLHLVTILVKPQGSMWIQVQGQNTKARRFCGQFGELHTCSMDGVLSHVTEYSPKTCGDCWTPVSWGVWCVQKCLIC